MLISGTVSSSSSLNECLKGLGVKSVGGLRTAAPADTRIQKLSGSSTWMAVSTKCMLFNKK